MQLSRKTLKSINATEVLMPDEDAFGLPEKVLQFGTGVLLRGLPDFFIDKANRLSVFNGRVVMVKSTDGGSKDDFEHQDCLYTVCIRGIEDGKEVEEFIINSSISRVLSAKENWPQVLECAKNPGIEIIISNTTEVGIKLIEDDVNASPPKSFPGKLLSFLHARYKAFDGNIDKGMVVVPTELIVSNGTQLKDIVLELAKQNRMDDDFTNWISNANHFCNSLVDRIVPGILTGAKRQEIEDRLGYTDPLMIMAEPFRLWAIQTPSKEVEDKLAFARADDGVVLANNIDRFRELKLRLLNGTHSFSCGLAFLAGFKTVKAAMNDPVMNAFIENIALNEIAIAISSDKDSFNEACNFANKVLDRFRNPFIDHQWLNICLQYSSKMKMRNAVTLEKYYGKYSVVPSHMALGFAGWLYFMKCSEAMKGGYEGNANGLNYPITDDRAGWFADRWQANDVGSMVNLVFTDRDFWSADIDSFNGFAETVKKNIDSFIKNGVIETIRTVVLKKTE